MTKRNGARPKSRRKRPSAVNGGDDRPHGFQPDRMRALWDNIDHARAKLAPDPPESAPAPSLLASFLPAIVFELTPCALLARAGGWIVRVPGVDWLLGFWRSSPST